MDSGWRKAGVLTVFKELERIGAVDSPVGFQGLGRRTTNWPFKGD
jgi:hypothetical protein